MDEDGRTIEDLLEEVRTLQHKVADFERCDLARDRLEELMAATEREQRLFGERLVSLVNITNDLSMAKTTEQLCRRAVVLAREQLGFDRIGIWFCTDQPGVIAGSYGIDWKGRICDERGKRTHVDLNGPEGRVLLSKEPLVLTGEGPVVNLRGEVVGRGEQAFAAIWDGEKVIGHISMDNRIRKEPITQHQCELLRLFGSTIGYLYARIRAEQERERLIVELREALAKIKTLRGLLPICANCKKIRDDQGYWNRIEHYIREHSEAEFSHGLCPECMKLLYPEIKQKNE